MSASSSDISLLGFDEDCISFEVRGDTAQHIAILMGNPFGYEPGTRMKAVTCVTLFREDLTHAATEGRIEEGEGDCPAGSTHPSQLTLPV